MILPSKHLPQNRALLTIGAHILNLLILPKTVSALWEELNSHEASFSTISREVTYDWFVLALDLLYTFGAIELERGLVARRTV